MILMKLTRNTEFNWISIDYWNSKYDDLDDFSMYTETTDSANMDLRKLKRELRKEHSNMHIKFL